MRLLKKIKANVLASIYRKQKKRYELKATENFKMLLTMIRS